jgi:8-oxo-dGTP diphosphatase
MVSVELVPAGTEPGKISYVVIAARHEGGWIFIKHRRRGGYELPAGHPEAGEDTVDAAARELKEETGAIDFTMEPVTFYSVDAGQGKQYGRLFFACVETLGAIGDMSEIEGLALFRRMPRNISLPEVMTFLYRQAAKYLRYNRY